MAKDDLLRNAHLKRRPGVIGNWGEALCDLADQRTEVDRDRVKVELACRGAGHIQEGRRPLDVLLDEPFDLFEALLHFSASAPSPPPRRSI